jgi:hypothetical protein
MHIGIVFRQLLNQMLFAAKPWQQAAIVVAVAVGGLAMIPAGIVLGHYEMSLGGILLLAVAASITRVMLRERRNEKDASR